MLLRSRIAWLGLVVFLSTVVSAYAQAKPAQPGPYPPPAPPYPTAEVTGGYQLLHVPDQTFPFGLNLTAPGTPARRSGSSAKSAGLPTQKMTSGFTSGTLEPGRASMRVQWVEGCGLMARC